MNMNDAPDVPRNKSASTLIKVVAVALVLALLVVVYIGISAPRGSPEAYRRTQDRANLRQICIAMYIYAQDNEDVLPLHPRSINSYLGKGDGLNRMFFNPYQETDEVVEIGLLNDPAMRFGGYIYLRLGENINDIMEPSNTIIAYTAKVSEEQTTRGVQFLDGHVENWEEEKFRAALPEGVDVDALDGP